MSCKYSQQVHIQHVTMLLNSGNREQPKRSTNNKHKQHFTKNRTAYFQTAWQQQSPLCCIPSPQQLVCHHSLPSQWNGDLALESVCQDSQAGAELPETEWQSMRQAQAGQAQHWELMEEEIQWLWTHKPPHCSTWHRGSQGDSCQNKCCNVQKKKLWKGK